MNIRFVRHSSFLLLATGLFAFQVNFRQFADEEDNPAPVPPGAYERTEWAFARLKYPSGRYAGFWGGRGSWPTDYPKADRQFVTGVKRLTRIHTRSSEQIIDLEDSANPREILNWPWVYATEVGHWDLTPQQCQTLREYLLRGGFLMVDDFHGNYEWDVFNESMRRIFPDRPIVEIPQSDPIFHTIYDLNDKLQVPGIVYLESHKLYEKGGTVPHWRGVYDDHGRVMAAMTFNQDNGDAWEHADNPQYEERFSSQAYRLGIDYIVYAMTH